MTMQPYQHRLLGLLAVLLCVLPLVPNQNRGHGVRPWYETPTKNSTICELRNATTVFTASSSCVRQCPHSRRNNKIVLFFQGQWYEQAGLNDRVFVFQRMGHLAGYLCARLYVPKPYLLLDRKHNHNRIVSRELTWSDFVELRFGDSGEAVIASEFDKATDGFFTSRTSMNETMNGLTTKNDIRIVSENPNQFGHHLELVHNFTQQQQQQQQLQKEESPSSFVWAVGPSYYLLQDVMQAFLEHQETQGLDDGSLPELIRQPNSKKRCTYVESQNPLFLREQATAILTMIQEQHPAALYGGLHIRRGDAVNQCNTSLAKMAHFVPCTWDGTELTQQTLLFYSDERDACYRTAIHQLFDSLKHVTVIDLDEMIQQELDRVLVQNASLQKLDNNYIRFQLNNDIARQLDYVVEQERHNSCEPCVHLTSCTMFPRRDNQRDQTPGPMKTLDFESILADYEQCSGATTTNTTE